MSNLVELIATLGSEPQVVAIATQLLLADAYDLRDVVVLHTQPDIEPIASALVSLKQMFLSNPHWPPTRLVTLPTTDVLDPAQLDKFAILLFQTIKRTLTEGRTVHLLLAGGRKPMAMMGMSVAQVLLGPQDRIWYLHSDEDLRKSGRWQLQSGDQARLIPIPLPAMRAAPASFTRAFAANTPQDAYSALADEQSDRLRAFVEQTLTPAERQVAALVSEDVLTVEQIGERLHKSPKTVTNQLTVIYSKLESAFGLQPDVGVKREFLRREMRGYFGS